MKLVREVIVLAMVAYVGWLWIFISDLRALASTNDLNKFSQNAPFYLVIISPFIILIIAILFVRKIDTWEDAKSDKQHKELLDAINGLAQEIRDDRRQRNEHRD